MASSCSDTVHNAALASPVACGSGSRIEPLGNVARRFSSSRALRVPAPEDGGSSGWEDVSPANPRGAPNFVGLQDVSGPEGGVYGSVDELSLHAMPPVSPQTQPTSSGKHKVSFAAQPP